jgi:hypothetical protein
MFYILFYILYFIDNKIIINNSNKNQIVIGAVMHVNRNILSIVIYNYL